MRNFHIIFLLLFVLTGCDKKNDWSYDSLESPEHWHELSKNFAKCKKGRNQSPLELNQFESIIFKQKFSNNYRGKKPFVTAVNNGHSIELDFKDNYYATLDDKKFKLVQLHFHAASEHVINGMRFPAEVHLVHETEKGELLVIAVLISLQKEINEIISLNHLPAVNEKLTTQIDMSKILPESMSHFYYKGSLTTPPCTENVNWIVLKEPMKVSTEQLKKFKAYYSHNFRPVQNDFNRPVYFAE